MPINQKDLPIILILQGGEFFAGKLPLPFLFGSPGGIVRPRTWHLRRPSRGTVVGTVGASFLDDFGSGVPALMMEGSTGWNEPEGFAGIVAMQLLEVIVQEYLQRRKRTAEAGLDPNLVRLLYLDALNVEAFLVYPQEFNIDRTSSDPLLRFYQLRFTILRDLKYEALYGIANVPVSEPLKLLNTVRGQFAELLP